jgi:hypothetical protein
MSGCCFETNPKSDIISFFSRLLQFLEQVGWRICARRAWLEAAFTGALGNARRPR